MTDPRPAPYPSDTLAKGWRFEVNTEQVKKSETWLRARTGYVRAHLLLLWSEAWEQTPCGSLPDDDELLALLLDMEPEEFAKHRSVLMRGWWLAEDGRLYHDTVTERVLAMLQKRSNDAARAAKNRAKNTAQVATAAVVTRDERATNVPIRGEFDTKHQAPDTREEEPPHPPAGGADGFDRFWFAWPKHPRKVAPAQCRKKWEAKDCEPIADRIVAHVEAMKRTEQWQKDGAQFIPAPLVYLNQERWIGAIDAAEVGEWFDSVAGIRAKGVELGVGDWSEPDWVAGRAPDYPTYRARVFKAAGHSPRAAA